MLVPLDNPIEKRMPDGQVVLFDHLWLTSIHADANDPNKPITIRLIMHKARIKPDGSRELYQDEEPLELVANDFFALAMQNPAWVMTLEQILAQGKLWARANGMEV